jgi:hypothetical protein
VVAAAAYLSDTDCVMDLMAEKGPSFQQDGISHAGIDLESRTAHVGLLCPTPYLRRINANKQAHADPYSVSDVELWPAKGSIYAEFKALHGELPHFSGLAASLSDPRPVTDSAFCDIPIMCRTENVRYHLTCDEHEHNCF